MRIFLTDSVAECNLSAPLLSGENVESVSSDPVSLKKEQIITTLPSVKDLFALLKTRYVFIFIRLIILAFHLVSIWSLKFRRCHVCTLMFEIGFKLNFSISKKGPTHLENTYGYRIQLVSYHHFM